MYTMKDFKEKHIAVRVGREHMAEFLRMCEAEGLRWRHGDKPTEFNPAIHHAYADEVTKATCVTTHCEFGGGHMMWGSRDAYEEQGLTIVDFKDFVTQTTQPRYKIVIECDGTTTTARMEINGKEVKTAQTKRNPADKFDWSIGAQTAFGRLFSKKEEKPEEKKERPFKVGDRVVCVKEHDGNFDVNGKHGVVKNGMFSTGTNIAVEFDEPIKGGHGLCGDGRDGHCWYIARDKLRHE